MSWPTGKAEENEVTYYIAEPVGVIASPDTIKKREEKINKLKKEIADIINNQNIIETKEHKMREKNEETPRWGKVLKITINTENQIIKDLFEDFLYKQEKQILEEILELPKTIDNETININIYHILHARSILKRIEERKGEKKRSNTLQQSNNKSEKNRTNDDKLNILRIEYTIKQDDIKNLQQRFFQRLEENKKTTACIQTLIKEIIKSDPRKTKKIETLIWKEDKLETLKEQEKENLKKQIEEWRTPIIEKFFKKWWTKKKITNKLDELLQRWTIKTDDNKYEPVSPIPTRREKESPTTNWQQQANP